jgi:threonine dehydrogenase-like Zn-dependent dehydrogenase
MRALRFDGRLRLATRVPVPRPARGEALIRVRRAGICRTDLEIAKGYMGFRGTLGHEFVGEVVAARDRALVGRRVAGEINCGCGRCASCRRGEGNHCPTRTVLGIVGRDGAFADWLTLPEANLHPLPDGLPDEAAVFVEPVAAAFRILDDVDVAGAGDVLVLGDGKLALLVAQVLGLVNRRVALIGRHAAKVARARRLGIDARRGGRRAPAPADVVVDCTGSAEGFPEALALTRPRGTLVLKSTAAHGAPLNLAPVVIHELKVVGSRCGPFTPAIAALRDGRVRVGPLVTATLPAERALEAFRAAGARGALKVQIDFSAA